MSTPRNFYSDLEKNLLMKLIEKHKNVLASKRNDWQTIKHKMLTWQSLAAEFNSHGGVSQRSAKQLKKCWENMKARSKTNMAARPRRRYFMAGGGGHMNTTITTATTTTTDASPIPEAQNAVIHQPLQVQAPIMSEYNTSDVINIKGESKSDEDCNQTPECAATVQPTPIALMPAASAAMRMPTFSSYQPRRTFMSRPTRAAGSHREALRMQEEEHYLQMKLLEQQLEHSENEHLARMRVIELQQQILTIERDNLLTQHPAMSFSTP